MIRIILKVVSRVLILAVFFSLAAVNGYGKETHGSHDHDKMVMAASERSSEETQQVKIEEKLGRFANLDTRFKNENGEMMKLSKLFDKPVVILPIFFSCAAVCGTLQSELANALNFVDQIPGKDFNIITLSFDDEEDHTFAKTAKQNYTNLIQRDFPIENWHYLTGDRTNILKLTDSLGYFFIKKDKHLYIHPSAMIVLTHEGKIARYLYGPSFLPFDLGMALAEADQGKTGISIKRGVLSFCFDYDAENKTYVFKMFRITGTAILVLLIGFIVFLVYPNRRDKDEDTIVS